MCQLPLSIFPDKDCKHIEWVLIQYVGVASFVLSREEDHISSICKSHFAVLAMFIFRGVCVRTVDHNPSIANEDTSLRMESLLKCPGSRAPTASADQVLLFH